MDDPVHINLFARIEALEDRITSHLADDVVWHRSIDAQLAANTEITTQVRDILTSFRTMALFSKWVAAIGAAVAAVVAAWNSIFK